VYARAKKRGVSYNVAPFGVGNAAKERSESEVGKNPLDVAARIIELSIISDKALDLRIAACPLRRLGQSTTMACVIY
jgi:hypothetical protein